jgi:general secretion pathway protein D
MLSGTEAETASMLEVIDLFDVDEMRNRSLAIFPVDAADPATVAQELDTVFGNGSGTGVVRFVANRRLRSVLAISSRPEYLRRVASWFDQVRSVSRSAAREFFSYKVRNRPAGELAQLLTRIYGGSSAVRQQAAGGSDAVVAPDAGARPPALDSGAGAAPVATAAVVVDPTRSAAGGTQPAAPSALAIDPTRGPAAGAEERGPAGGVSIVPDEANRMLLISATRAEYRRILSILERVDTLPDQVMIEATIAEVTLNDDLQMGVRWFFQKNQHQLSFTDSLVGAIAPTFPGFSYFFNSLNVQVVLNALSAVTDVNVVSSPTLTVLDGKRATLQVGDEVPIITQQAIAVTTPGAPVVNSVQYRNTGVILGIVPRINEKGRILLDIEQEVSEVGTTTSSNIDSPTFQQRRIKTTVSVRDGESLALGGLMQDRSSLARDQVPIAGEVPVLGNLFKSKTDTIKRTELLIIMTPRVVRDANQVRWITDEFRDKLNFSLRPQRQGPPGPREKIDRIQR